MRITATLLVAFTALAAFAFDPGEARAQSAAALSGQVTSAEEGAMEGVVVSAKRDGSTITISVVTDAQGRYAFPAAQARARQVHAASRAPPATSSPARRRRDVAAGQEAKADLKLTKLRSLSAHLTNAEWLHSMPGTEQQKKFLLNCIGCHTLERIMKSTLRRRGLHRRHQPDGDLLSGHHAAASAAAGRQFPAHARPRQREADRGVARDHQSEPAGHLAVPAQDPAAADRKIDARSSSPNTTCRKRISSRTT